MVLGVYKLVQGFQQKCRMIRSSTRKDVHWDNSLLGRAWRVIGRGGWLCRSHNSSLAAQGL